MTTPKVDPGSFRDRDGRVFYREGRVFRALSQSASEDWQALAQTDLFTQATRDGRIIPTWESELTAELTQTLGDHWAAVLEHQRVPFVSYPYEWPFSMLKDAALLQLDLTLEALKEGLILKDSSAYNIQWIGSKPVFVDVASFERWQPGEPWVGYRQFCQLFLYPLMLTAYKNIPFQPWLRGALDGITPADCLRIMSWRDRFRRGVFSHVYFQSKLLEMTSSPKSSLRSELKSSGLARSIIERNLTAMHATVAKLEWRVRRSEWASYASEHSYQAEDEEIKKAFVEQAAASKHWRLVWDLGCNIGLYSRIASAHADSVIAMDADLLAVDSLYRALESEGNRTILPLTVNLADPSPDLGWRGRERRSLEARGKPELVLCLALVHHMVIGANIPLADFVEWLASLDAHVVIELVTREDAMVKKLLLNREDIYHDYSLGNFERLISTSFDTMARQPLHGGTRVLFFLAPTARSDQKGQ